MEDRDVASEDQGAEPLMSFARELYPLCRSITGMGVRKTLDLIGDRIPLERTEVPTGTRVFDWEVPLEWNIDDAWLKDGDGRKIVDFQQHNLHVVSYSTPIDETLAPADLQANLHSIPEHPDWIPYRTSYYRPSWGFCLSDNQRKSMTQNHIRGFIDSDLSPGALSYGEFFLPGAEDREFLFSTHICHPSLANDNTSGMAIATALAEWLASEPRRYSYRIVFVPGTIGSLCWLSSQKDQLGKIDQGLVIGLLGDKANLTYKQSRTGNRLTDQLVPMVLESSNISHNVMPYEPYGYDERQYCSPGIDLPVGRLTRSINSGYPQYHTSADNLSLLSEARLQESLDALKQIVVVTEANRRFKNLSPGGEPQLGKRGLYDSVGGTHPGDYTKAMLWVLSYSDGQHNLLDISHKSTIDFATIAHAASRLEAANLLETCELTV